MWMSVSSHTVICRYLSPLHNRDTSHSRIVQQKIDSSFFMSTTLSRIFISLRKRKLNEKPPFHTSYWLLSVTYPFHSLYLPSTTRSIAGWCALRIETSLSGFKNQKLISKYGHPHLRSLSIFWERKESFAGTLMIWSQGISFLWMLFPRGALTLRSRDVWFRKTNIYRAFPPFVSCFAILLT